MSPQRFTRNLKQKRFGRLLTGIIQLGEFLPIVSIGVLRRVAPDKTEKEASDLLDAKSEILRLRAQLRRTEEERDILKKAARYGARRVFGELREAGEICGKHRV